MLDTQIISQLSDIFSSIEGEYTFLAHLDSTTDSGKEMHGFLTDFCSASPKFIYREESSTGAPKFCILKNGKETGISFTGIPGGHEFNTLILAVANADGKGKNLPDSQTVKRIEAIKGKISLRTFVSLSCTNCPDVAQVLNIITLCNPGIHHEIIDGNADTQEMKRLGIQAVPTTYADGRMFSVGRASLSDLIGKLEEMYGTVSDSNNSDPTIIEADLMVLGGGPAGIAASVYSARKNLNVALITEESGGSVNLTNDIDNLITTGSTTGGKLAATLRENALASNVKLFEGRKAIEIHAIGETKEIACAGGEIFRAPRMIIATGSRPRRMNVEGEEKYVGKGVAFCPHCDGPLFKDKDVAVVGGGNAGIEAAIDLSSICKSVTVFEFLDTLRADNVLIDKATSIDNIKILTGMQVQEVVGDERRVTGIKVKDINNDTESKYFLSGIFVQIGSVPDTSLIKEQIELNDHGEIKIDRYCRTSLPKVYAAGDVTDAPFKQIATAVGSGATAALASFEDSLHE